MPSEFSKYVKNYVERPYVDKKLPGETEVDFGDMFKPKKKPIKAPKPVGKLEILKYVPSVVKDKLKKAVKAYEDMPSFDLDYPMMEKRWKEKKK